MANVKPIPDGYPRLSPSLAVDGAAAAIDFYTSVLGAKERMRMEGPPGRIAHCELEFQDGSVLMLNDESPEMGALGPKAVGGTPVVLSLYTEDVDAMVAAAEQAGATIKHPIQDQFYGDRSGAFEDPWGHVWYIATHTEDLSEEEMARRQQEMMAGRG